jgi:adenylate kinase
MIVFMGVAGSGKSTMGQLLAANMHCPWISTGNLLRQIGDKDTQKQLLKGEIINDERTLVVVDEELRRIGADRNQLVLDGMPRTMRQAKWLVEKEKNGELKITAIIHLISSKEIAKDRLLARQRPDDHEEAITARFREFDDAIVPILDYLASEGYKVHSINAEQNPIKVEHDIEKALGI